ncbi:MAG: hypothetical protein ABIC95_04920 [archaeon]
MNAEKEIVLWWLQHQGYFCITGIKAGRNRDVGILGVHHQKGSYSEVVHVETAVSVSSSEPESLEEFKRKFFSRPVQQAVQKTIKKTLGSAAEPRRLLITTSNKAQQLKQVDVMPFSRVIGEVLLSLDTGSHDNPVIRTLQLLKYSGITDPQTLAGLVSDAGTDHAFTLREREGLLAALLVEPAHQRMLGKRQHEPLILGLLKESSLNSPERLAAGLDTEVLGKRNRKRFIEHMLALELKDRKPIKKARKNQQTLSSF